MTSENPNSAAHVVPIAPMGEQRMDWGRSHVQSENPNPSARHQRLPNGQGVSLAEGMIKSHDHPGPSAHCTRTEGRCRDSNSEHRSVITLPEQLSHSEQSSQQGLLASCSTN